MDHSMTQQDLLGVLERAWRALDDASAGLDADALSAPGVVGAWSITDVLGHVTVWDSLVVDHLERWRRGEPLPVRDWDAVDDYNAREVARRQGWSVAQLRAEANDVRGRLRTLIAGMMDDEWATPVTLNGRERPRGEWVGGATSGDGGAGTHAAEHAAAIRAWRAAERTDG